MAEPLNQNMTTLTTTAVSGGVASEGAASEGQSTEAYQATQYVLRRKLPPSLYYKFRTFSRQYPALFLPFSRWRWTRWRQKYLLETALDMNAPEPAAPQPLMPDTEIVIEGFPRTANTFTHIAFKTAQARPVKIGHHTHAAAQVIAAVRRQIPTMVLIRDPEEAIISYAIGDFDPQITMRQIIQDYICFYKPLLPYRDRFVLAPFAEITANYGAIIHRVNEKFGTQFSEFDHTPENVEQCFSLINEGCESAFGILRETVVSRPSESRKALQAELKQEFYSQPLSQLRAEAYRIYEALMAAS